MLAFYIIADMTFASANHIVSHYVKAVLSVFIAYIKGNQHAK
ncbi:hypothetical protein SAMN05421766_103525 [Zobellia uliginosa]|uniref:Uncharacterized protein n=1 Tax=Zobellia uliginosa TaxID=143224 RepID=A0ABY1KS70_9FLAO|nr:hypothetical protein SAMN05421766_103525 [Zobellia uliginosa]